MLRRKLLLRIWILLSIPFLGVQALAGDPVYMHLEGIDGQIQEPAYKDTFECLSMSFNVVQNVSNTVSAEASRTSGAPVFSGLRCVTPISKSSSLLAAWAINLAPLSSAVIYITETNKGVLQTRFQIELEDVYLIAIGSGIAGDSLQPVETITMEYGSIRVVNPGAGQSAGYDLRNETPL